MILVEYLKLFKKSKVGQAVLAFLRVFAVTVVACWVDAGMPVTEFSAADLGEWVELGVQAAAGLVLVNYFGPWEKRYGRKTGTEE